MSTEDTKRLYTLDAMRGLAAFVVVLHHQKAIPTPGGYLAVDFFFALSGLVIAGAYERRLQSDMGFGQFMLKRILRLYPMLLLGMLIGGVRGAIMSLSSPKEHTPLELAINFASGALFLPSPASAKELFPLNLPAWSLFFELVINAVYAAVLVRMSNRALFWVLGLATLALAGSTAYYGTFDGGFDWANIGQGLTRVAWSFTLGVVLYRLGLARPRFASLLAVVPSAILMIFLVAPVAAAARRYVDMSFALVFSPLLIVAAAALQPPEGVMRKVSSALGDMSYPLYAVHFPVLQLWSAVSQKLHVPPLLNMALYLPGICIISLILGRQVDLWLKNANALRAPRSTF